MAGKIYIIFEEIYEDDIEEIFEDSPLIGFKSHDYQFAKTNEDKGWFFFKDSCQQAINNDKDYAESTNIKLECVERCFCALYRARVYRSLRRRDFRSARKFFVAGFKRMIRDKFGDK